MKLNKTIEITISTDKNGYEPNVKIDVTNAHGSECVTIIETIQKLLDMEKIHEEVKSEYYHETNVDKVSVNQ